jgi:hypothetical protein
VEKPDNVEALFRASRAGPVIGGNKPDYERVAEVHRLYTNLLATGAERH